MTKLKPKLSRCPSCHRKGMRREVRDVELDGGKHVARGIEVDVCPSCGEQLYDPQAMRAIEATSPRRPQRRRKTTASSGR